MAQLNMNRNGSIAKWLKKSSADCIKALKCDGGTELPSQKREEKIHFVGNFYRNFKRFTEQQHKEEKREKSVDC